MMNISFDPSGQPPKSLLARVIGVVAGVIALGVALMFSAVIFVILAIAGLALWGYFWWKTRALRRQMQEQMEQMRSQGYESPFGQAPADDNVIDGEAVRLDEDRNRLQ
ncbi:MAG: hypothetical protein QMB52_13430 [Propionivibrio sp.]